MRTARTRRDRTSTTRSHGSRGDVHGAIGDKQRTQRLGTADDHTLCPADHDHHRAADGGSTVAEFSEKLQYATDDSHVDPTETAVDARDFHIRCTSDSFDIKGQTRQVEEDR